MKKDSTFFTMLAATTGDFFTESAVLIFIFGILEKMASESSVPLTYGLSIIGITLIFLVLGCLIRSWRQV